MKLHGFLSQPQVETIHRNALRVLADIGVKVEDDEVLRRLEAIGGRCDYNAQIVRFPSPWVANLIAGAPKGQIAWEHPQVGLSGGVAHTLYLNPDTDRLEPFDEERFAQYAAFARHLSGVASLWTLGLPFVPAGTSAALHPLTEKLMAWKYGYTVGGEILNEEFCQPLLDMFTCHAQATGQSVAKVFCASGYLVSPLRLASIECRELLWFAERGLRMSIGSMPSQGGTAPITFAGCLALTLAEQIFIFLLRHAMFGAAEFAIGFGNTVLDMQTAESCFGRPEKARANLALADLGRFYGCRISGHGGHTDARRPSLEAGVQKATSALITALATGVGNIAAGQLSSDRIASPVQMVLDSEILGYLRALLARAQVDDESCAFEEIAGVGIGGAFLGTDFTVERFRAELFEPGVFTRGAFIDPGAAGPAADAEKARDLVLRFNRDYHVESLISADEERELQTIIRRAAADDNRRPS